MFRGLRPWLVHSHAAHTRVEDVALGHDVEAQLAEDAVDIGVGRSGEDTVEIDFEDEVAEDAFDGLKLFLK